MKSNSRRSMSTAAFLTHPIPPLYDGNSRILILGSFPSPKSREAKFFYGHPQNRFWKVMAHVLSWQGPQSGMQTELQAGIRSPAGPRTCSTGRLIPTPSFIITTPDADSADHMIRIPATIEEKSAMLYENCIALWDTIASCEITGASDASITNVTPNDLSVILDTAPVKAIFCNGAAAHTLYMKYIFPVTGRPSIRLPSTSPANAAWSLNRLTEVWKQELVNYLCL